MSSQATQYALVLSPHPDDESLGCGGTIKLITSSGGKVDVAYMTRGRHGHYPGVQADAAACDELAERRAAEGEAACAILGVSEVMFLGAIDGSVAQFPQLAQNINALLTQREYRSVFCPWPYDGHADHRATFVWLLHALAPMQRPLDVWLYEVWTPMPANFHICIDQTLDAKIEAINAHKSQVALLNYTEAFRGLSAYRSLQCPPARYAEAFRVVEAGALVRNEEIPWPRPQELQGLGGVA